MDLKRDLAKWKAFSAKKTVAWPIRAVRAPDPTAELLATWLAFVYLLMSQEY
jgi:hypothetical protein